MKNALLPVGTKVLITGSPHPLYAAPDAPATAGLIGTVIGHDLAPYLVRVPSTRVAWFGADAIQPLNS